jgi:type VI secretion system protein ImpK
MSPDFARVVDPIFLHVIGLLDRIERNQAPEATLARAGIEYRLNQAEQAIGHGHEQWKLAKYALVAWIDELLIDAPWEGRGYWKEHSLEMKLFKGATAHETFYLRAEEAKGQATRDALEVFYVCVVLGFRGVYRNPKDNEDAKRLGLPDSLAKWAQHATLAISLKHGRREVKTSANPGCVAPPLYGRSKLVAMTLAFLSAAAITLFISILCWNW